MLRVVLLPSRRLTAVLTAAHGAAALTLVPLALPVWAKAAIVALIAASLAHALWRHAWLRNAGSVTSIELGEGDRAAVETRGGGRYEARVLGTTYVTPQLCVLNLRLAGRRFPQHALIVRDNIDTEAFRLLRVRLRWGFRTDV